MNDRPQISIRIMQKEHCPGVYAIERAAFSQPWPMEEFEKAVQSDNYVYLAAEQDGMVCGYCGCVMSPPEADITNIAVDTDLRRLGIGEMLLRCMFSKLSEYGIDKVFLEVRESNEAARNLYAKMGFVPIGRRRNFYSLPTEDAILMSRDIKESEEM